MIRVYIFGITGKMGQILKDSLPDDFIISGSASNSHTDITPSDVIIDFSSAQATSDVIALADKLNCPLVIATTGQNTQQMEMIKKCSARHAVLKSENMSIGINLLIQACRLLNGVGKCEIVECHHQTKKDAPSGTALMLQKASGAINIHSLRLGSSIGEHSVVFGLENETITLSHTAINRRIFADGAFNAARWLLTQPYGLYSFEDYLSSPSHYSQYHSSR